MDDGGRARGFSASGAHRVTPPGDPELFPTPPWGARAGGELVRRLDPEARTCWECACGSGHMVHGLQDYFDRVVATDRHDWGWSEAGVYDFLGDPGPPPIARPDWIITNPPFGPAEPFIAAALERAQRGVAMLLRLNFLETSRREQLIWGARPVTVVAPFIERLAITKGRWDPNGSTAQAYAWFIWLSPWIRKPAWLGPGTQMIPILTGTKARLSKPTDLVYAGPCARAVEIWL